MAALHSNSAAEASGAMDSRRHTGALVLAAVPCFPCLRARTHTQAQLSVAPPQINNFAAVNASLLDIILVVY